MCSSDPSHQPVELGGNKVAGKDLVSIDYFGTPATSPKYSSAAAEHVVTLQTSKMHVNVNRPILASILQMSKEVSDSMALLQPTSGPSNQIVDDQKGKGKEVEKAELGEDERLEREKKKNQEYVQSISRNQTDSGSALVLSPQGTPKLPAAKSSVPMAKATLKLGSVSLSLNVENNDDKKNVSP